MGDAGNTKPQGPPGQSTTEDDAAREETIDTLLHPDRAKHDELGRTDGGAGDTDGPAAPSSPREQPAAPIDVTNVDE